MNSTRLYVQGLPDWVEEEELIRRLVECAEDGNGGVRVSDVQWLKRFGSAHLDFHGTKDQLDACCRALNGTKWGGSQPLRVLRAREGFKKRLEREWAEDAELLVREKQRQPSFVDSSQMVLPKKVSKALSGCKKTSNFRDTVTIVKNSTELTWTMDAPDSRPGEQQTDGVVPQRTGFQSATQTALSFLGVGQMTDARKALNKRIRSGLRDEELDHVLSVEEETSQSLAVLAEIMPETLNLAHSEAARSRSGRWRNLGLRRRNLQVIDRDLFLPRRHNIRITDGDRPVAAGLKEDEEVSNGRELPPRNGRWRSDLLDGISAPRVREWILPRRAVGQTVQDNQLQPLVTRTIPRSSFAFNF